MNDTDHEALNEAAGLPKEWRPLSLRYPEHFPNSQARHAAPATKEWARNFERFVGHPPTTPIEGDDD